VSDSDSLLREVEEEVRRERYEQLFREYGPYVIGGIVVALILVAGYLWWQNQKEVAAQSASLPFLTAKDQIEAENYAAARESLTPLVSDSPGVYPVLAKMELAAAALGEGKLDEALALYKEVAAEGSAPREIRDAATIRAKQLQADMLSPAELRSGLEDLAGSDRAFAVAAQDLIAYSHFREQAYAAARPIYDELAENTEAPQSLRARARNMVLLIDSLDPSAQPQTPVEDGAPAEETPAESESAEDGSSETTPTPE